MNTNPKSLFDAKKYFDEDDDFSLNKKKDPVIKRTTSLYGNSTIKPNTKNDKSNNEIDDLLKWIEEPKESSTSQKNTKKNEEKDAFDFLDDMLPDNTNIPIIDNTRPRRSTTTSSAFVNEDAKSKMSSLFDLSSNPSKTNLNDTKPPISRPTTTTSIKEETNQDSVGEINLAFSRRKRSIGSTGGGGSSGGGSTNTTRPFTSPGETIKNDFGNDDITRDTQTTFGMTDSFPDKISSTRDNNNNNNDDDYENQDSTYMNSFMNRHSRITDRKVSRSKTAIASDLKDKDNQQNSKVLLSPGKNSFRNTTDNNTGMQNQDNNTSNNMRNMIASTITQKEDPNKSFTTNQSTIITAVTPNSRNFSRQENLNNKLDEKINSIIKPNQANVEKSTIAMENFKEEVNTNNNNMENKGIFFATSSPFDLTTKNILKETEEYYKNLLEELKKAHLEERKKWEEIHKQELELIRKEKQLLIDNLETNIQRERDRLKEMHALELESHDRLHKYELDRQKHMLEEQNESLKKQLDAQIQLNSLADQIRNSSHRLASLSDKMELDKQTDDTVKKQELIQKEKQLKDLETKLKYEYDLLENEKKRYEKLRIDLDERENEFMKNIDREKEMLKQEYSRLTDLQSTIRQVEMDKRKELINEKESLEYTKNQLEKENLKLKEEYRQKYSEFEMRLELFEEQKRSFNKMMNDTESDWKNKMDEVDELKKKLLMQEAEIMKKSKIIEVKESNIAKIMDELQSRIEIFNLEKMNFEKERYIITEIAQKTKEEGEYVNRFKREFDQEKEKFNRMKMELDFYAQNLQSEKLKTQEEKNNVNQIQKMFENLRYGYVKDLANQTMSKTFIGGTAFKDLGKTNKPPLPISTSDMAIITNSNNNPSLMRLNLHKRHDMSLGMNDSFTGNQFYMKNYGEKRESINHIPHRATSAAAVDRKSVINENKNIVEEKKVDILQPPQRNSSGDYKAGIKKFDLNNFMEQLKNIEQTSYQNQNYITKEKESLLRTKLETTDNGYLSQLKNSLSSNTTSPLESGKFRSSYYSNAP